MRDSPIIVAQTVGSANTTRGVSARIRRVHVAGAEQNAAGIGGVDDRVAVDVPLEGRTAERRLSAAGAGTDRRAAGRCQDGQLTDVAQERQSVGRGYVFIAVDVGPRK